MRSPSKTTLSKVDADRGVGTRSNQDVDTPLRLGDSDDIYGFQSPHADNSPFLITGEGPAEHPTFLSPVTSTDNDLMHTAAALQEQLYCLSLVDTISGKPVRAVSVEEAEELAKILLDCEAYTWLARPREEPKQLFSKEEEEEDEDDVFSSDISSPSPTVRRSPSLAPPSSVHAPKFSYRSGGPCDHCGARDSPQWRRGPADKPCLCNACGTRYRRTHQLNPSHGTGPRLASKRRSLELSTRAVKQPRMVLCHA